MKAVMRIGTSAVFILCVLFCLSGVAAAKSAVQVNGYSIDVTAGEPEVPKSLEAAGEGRFKKWIVQLAGPVREADKKELLALGCRVGDYLPEFAFVVTMTNQAKKRVEDLSFVRGVIRYQPAYKVDRKLKDAKGIVSTDNAGKLKLHIRVDGADNLPVVLSEVHKKKGRVVNVGSDIVMVEINRADIAHLARIEEVLWIEEAPNMTVQNDTTRWVIQTNIANNTLIWDKGLRGEGQIVGIADTGLDYDMPWFRDPSDAKPIGPTHRKIIGYDITYGDDYDANDPGHGTHVAGVLGGDRAPVDGLTSANGAAPKSRFYIQDITKGPGTLVTPPSDLGFMFSKAYDAGVRIHNNSWGGFDGTYGTLALSADRFLWEHKDFLALFANGNGGPNANTVLNPATAKNVISVGASMNGVSAENVADFSSNGVTSDGRIKPTVTAPGEGAIERVGIISADSDGIKNSGNGNTVAMRGTSMATAAVSGAALLVRQYFMDGYYPSGAADPADAFVPSAALVKAAIVNSAQNMTGDYTDGSIPATGQGWGRVNLSSTLAFQGDSRLLAMSDITTGLATGESWSRTYFSPGGQPVKVSLVWTDFPGSSAASKALVNDLDLSVVAPDGTTTYLGNVFSNGVSVTGGNPDRLNVEEQIVAPSASSGTYTVIVTGYNIPQGPQPFAVVITGVSNVTSKGVITLNKSAYNGSSTVVIKVGDRDLNGNASAAEEVYVSILSTTEPGGESVRLVETAADSGVFSGSITLHAGAPVSGNGSLEVAHGDTVTATYNDADDGSGSPAAVIASARIDLVPPVITAVAEGSIDEVNATITWTTSEPATSRINYGDTAAREFSQTDPALTTQHTMKLTGLGEGRTYYYDVSSTDEAGNTAVSDNSGSFYSFTTVNVPPSLTVNSSEGSTTYRESTVVYGIAKDASLVASVTVNGVPAAYRGSDGYYELRADLAIGDNPLTVIATDTAGNATELVIPVVRLDTPDLGISFLYTAASGAGTGRTISLYSTVCNSGIGNSRAFSVGFYLSLDNTITTDDIHFENQDAAIAALPAGACASGWKTLTIPMNITAGAYYIGAIADYGDVQYESDETNNSYTGSQLDVEGPDLAVTVVSGPETSPTGSAIIVKNTITNLALAAQSSGFYVNIYLSEDDIITTSDLQVGSRYVSSLSAGVASAVDSTITIPGNIEGGTYYIGVIADTFNQVNELNKLNNAVAGNQIVLTGTDLTMTAVTAPASAVTGGSITVTNTVAASPDGGSAGGFYVGLYLSGDNVITIDDTLIAYRWVSSLASGTDSTEHTLVTVPTYLAGGAYYIGAIADYADAVNEPVETNNALTGNQVTIIGPDLTMIAASGPMAGVPGGEITITSTVKASSAGGGAGAFANGIYLSTDEQIDASDIFLGVWSVTSLAPGVENTDVTRVTIPVDVPAGLYHIGVIADYLDNVRESDESNNSFKGSQMDILKPDLTVTAVSGPSSARTGDAITVSSTIMAAAAGAPAGSFSVGMYLSTDAVITADDILLQERPVSGLAPGASSSGDVIVTIPTSIAGGSYYIGAIADTRNTVIESDETNNSRAGNQITLTGPDVVMTSVSGPVSARTGNTITVSSTVTASASGGSAGSFSVDIYLSTDPVITTTDTLVAQRVVIGLAPGQSNAADTSVTIPTSLAGGSYYIGAIADSAYAVPDSDRTNNSRSGNAIVITGSDLVMSAVSGPAAASTGDLITVSDTVTASTAGGAAGPFSVGIYLSTDSVITSADTLLGTHLVSGLSPGASVSANTVVGIPAGMTGGAYYIGVIADLYSQVAESDETNNNRAGNQITITKASPDLLVASASGPADAATDQQILVAAVVRNQGQANAGPSWASVYLSTDAVITAADTLLGDAYVPALDAGAESSLSVPVTIPAAMNGGTYYIGVIADRWNQVTESNETNNSRAGNLIVITKLSPDLVVTAVSGPTSGVVKQQVTVTAQVRNQGQVTAGASYVGLYLSSDAEVTTGDLYLGQGYIGYLAPGEDQTVDVKVTIPQNARGTFYIGAVADRLNSVAESIETNNALTGNQIVIAK